jgi:hypothetical protein
MAQEYNRPRFLTLTPALVHQIRKEVLGMPKETALTCELKRLRNTRIISPMSESARSAGRDSEYPEASKLDLLSMY